MSDVQNNNSGIIEVKDVNVEEKAVEYQVQLRQSEEVKALSTTINFRDANAILNFGNEPAEEVSKFADNILNNIKATTAQGTSVMIKQLTDIMNRFDRKDFEKEEKKGFFAKVFGKGEDKIAKMMNKYKTIGGEIDGIYTEITKYKKDLNDSNLMLEHMYEQNFDYYKELEKYIAAGNIMVERIEQEEIPKMEKLAATGDQVEVMNLENAKGSLEMLKQRIYDLEMGKMVSLQTAPQIKMIQKGNYRLVSKIHSAFVITIPVFKNGVIQAIALKRQKLVSDSLSELDRTTNELLMKNAESIKNQSIDIERLSGGSSVKLDTLEKTWQTIMEGIDETKRIQEENNQLRIEGTKRIQEMNGEMKQKLLK